MTPSTAECARTRTLFFLRHPNQWPHWPYLPVVRRSPERDEELGVVFDCLNAGGPADYSCTVFRANLFLLPRLLDQLLQLTKEVYDTPE